MFLKPDFLSDAGMELTCSCAQMKAENMYFSKLVQLCPIGVFKPEIFAYKDKRAFFWDTLYVTMWPKCLDGCPV